MDILKVKFKKRQVKSSKVQEFKVDWFKTRHQALAAGVRL